MFELLRSWIKPVIIVTLLFFTATIVYQWGMDIGSSDRYSSSNPSAGIVNGEEVSRDYYNRVLNNLRSSQFANSEKPPTAGDLEKLRSQAWNDIVAEFALRQEIEKLGIDISEQELYYFIRYNPPAVLRNQPQFLTDGQFDYQKYLQVMAEPANAVFWANVEEYARPQARITRIQQIIASTAMLTREETKRAFLETRELASFGFVSVPTNMFPRDLVEVSEEDIKNSYDANRYRFKQVEKRSIDVARFSKSITELDWERVKQDAQRVAETAQGDEEFSDLAIIYSEDASGPGGGDLGFLKITDLDSLFVAGAMGLEVGGVSNPVRSAFGWHIIKLLAMRDDKGKETTDKDKAYELHTAHILLEVKSSDETIDASESRARQFHNLASVIGFDKAADSLGVEIKSPTPFKKSDPIQYLGLMYFAAEWTYGAKIGDISGIYDNVSNFYVMRLAGIDTEEYQPLSEVRDAMLSFATGEKIKAICLDTANAVYADIQNGMTLEEAAKAHNLEYATTTKISRNSSPPMPLGRDPKAIGAMFALSEIGQISEPVVLDRTATIFQLLERESPGLDEFTAARDSLSAQLLQIKQNNVWQKWYRDMIERTESENYLERQIANQRALPDSLRF